MNIITREPVLTMDVVKAALAALVVFGVDISIEQKAAAVALVAAVLALVTRQMVTPKAKVQP